MVKNFDRDFQRNFFISLGMHGLLFLLAWVGGEVLSKFFKNNDVEIIRSAVRVDVVGMPKFTIQELKKMEAQPVIQDEPKVVKGTKEESKAKTEEAME